ncbi:MAG: PAS domain-containing protein, partial [Candidatus Binatia bacterium]
MVSASNLVHKFATVQQHVEALQHHTTHDPGWSAGVRQKTFEDLQTALEALQTAEEDERQQNEELVRARQTIEVERRRYQELFDFAPDGYLVTDVSGTIQEANRAATALLQTSWHSLVGKQLLVFVPQAERKA